MTARSAAWTVSVVRAVPSTAAAASTSSVSRLMFVRLILVSLTSLKDTPPRDRAIHIASARPPASSPRSTKHLVRRSPPAADPRGPATAHGPARRATRGRRRARKSSPASFVVEGGRRWPESSTRPAARGAAWSRVRSPRAPIELSVVGRPRDQCVQLDGRSRNRPRQLPAGAPVSADRLFGLRFRRRFELGVRGIVSVGGDRFLELADPRRGRRAPVPTSGGGVSRAAEDHRRQTSSMTGRRPGRAPPVAIAWPHR